MSENINNTKIIWISVNIFMVIAMVIIGGITRLTDSGLSMISWNLLKGIIPPLNDQDWKNLFDLYKQYPEYNLKNSSMTIVEFKKIFFWEYLHRIWGRLIGLVFFLPFIAFWIKGWFNKKEIKLLILLSLLGFFQAFMGWYMVKSGLIEKPDVSHFRLSAHLLTAFFIYSVLLYYFWNLLYKRKVKEEVSKVENLNTHQNNLILSLFLLFTTISAGALVSGTDAGLSYNNFPLMGSGFLPPVLTSGDALNIKILLNDQGFLQFLHRILATTTLLFVLYTIAIAKKDNIFAGFINIFYLLIYAIIFQYALGVVILKLYVPMLLGLMHQLGSLFVLSLIIISLCEVRGMLGHKSVPTFKD